jgi:class II flagellar assembly regulator FliX
MRITGPNAAAAATTGGAAKRPANGAFSLGEPATARAASMPAALRTVGGIDALIALQGFEDATERRRQAVRRGRVALDALDELKLGVLGGTLSPATLGKLKSAAAFLKGGSGEPGLDGVLGEIELRVEVELAKMARQ